MFAFHKNPFMFNVLPVRTAAEFCMPKTLPQPQPQQRQHSQPRTLPLLTPWLCTVDWYAKTDTFVLGNYRSCQVLQTPKNF